MSSESNLPSERNPGDVSSEPQAVDVTAITAATHIGPLPTPADFREYDTIVPGAGNRILTMAEKEQDLRADIVGTERRRIAASTLVGLSTVGVAGLAVWKGIPYVAIPLGLAGVVVGLLRFVGDLIQRTGSPPNE